MPHRSATKRRRGSGGRDIKPLTGAGGARLPVAYAEGSSVLVPGNVCGPFNRAMVDWPAPTRAATGRTKLKR